MPEEPEFDFWSAVHITPAGFFLCLLASVPSMLISKLFVAVATPVAEGLVKSAHFEGEFTMPVAYFLVYGLAGYFFVWIGAQLTPRFRPFDILLYAVLAGICGLALTPGITAFGAFGASCGAIAAFNFLGRAFVISRRGGG